MRKLYFLAFLLLGGCSWMERVGLVPTVQDEEQKYYATMYQTAGWLGELTEQVNGIHSQGLISDLRHKATIKRLAQMYAASNEGLEAYTEGDTETGQARLKVMKSVGAMVVTLLSQHTQTFRAPTKAPEISGSDYLQANLCIAEQQNVRVALGMCGASRAWRAN